MATGKTKAASTAKQKTVIPAPESPAVAPLGQQLRAAREARDLTIEMVADELMIRKYYLDCLEDGIYRELPERVYAVGFVNNYAHLLGLDASLIVEQFKREAYGGRGVPTARVELAMPTPVSQSLLPNRLALFIIAALLVVFIVGGVIWNTRKPANLDAPTPQPPAVQNETLGLNSVSANSVVNSPPVPDRTAIVSSTGTVTTTNPASAVNADVSDAAPVPAAPDFAAPETVATPTAAAPTTTPAVTPAIKTPPIKAPEGTRILVEALQPSWVEIADAEGNILFTNILRLGQALPIPNKPGVTLTTGNAAGVQIILDGKKLGALGKTGEVKRAVALEPAQLTPAR